MQSSTELSKVLLKFVRLSQSSCCKAKASSLRGASSTNSSTIREIQYLRELSKVLLNLSVRPSQGSFKVLYKFPFRRGAKCESTERNARESCKMREY